MMNDGRAYASLKTGSGLAAVHDARRTSFKRSVTEAHADQARAEDFAPVVTKDGVIGVVVDTRPPGHHLVLAAYGGEHAGRSATSSICDAPRSRTEPSSTRPERRSDASSRRGWNRVSPSSVRAGMRTPVLLLALLLAAISACGEADPTPQAATTDPPDGTRWVGMNGVVVAVPDWWTTGDTRCATPVEDTVYFDSGAIVDCADPVPRARAREVSSLAVLDGTRGIGEWKIGEMQPVAHVEGHEVVELEECDQWFEGVCRRMFAVPELGVVFAVTIADPGDADYQAIRDSVRILPDGQTTVPLQAEDWGTPGWGAEPDYVPRLVRAVGEAGLKAEVLEERIPEHSPGMVADLPAGSYLGSDPELGSVVDEGATVRISVMPEQRT